MRIYIYIFLILSLTICHSCIHPKIKFRKAGLLDPMMDPAKTSSVGSNLGNEPLVWSEKGSTAVGASVGASCPTCGG